MLDTSALSAAGTFASRAPRYILGVDASIESGS